MEVPVAGRDYELQLPQAYMSVTQVNMAQRCLKQYEFRYVDGLKEPPALPLVEGGSHHTALEANNLHRIKKGANLAEKKMVDVFAHAFLKQEKDIPKGAWDGLNANEVIKRGKGIIGAFLESPLSKSRPAVIGDDPGVEYAFGGLVKYGEGAKSKQKHLPMVIVAGVPMAGFIDLVEDHEVSDYKVVGKSPSQTVAMNSLQLMLYASVMRTAKTRIVALTKAVTPKILEFSHKHNLKDTDTWVPVIVAPVAKSISAGIFPCAAPDNWACSPRFCGFYHRCRGANAQPRFFQVSTDGLAKKSAKKVATKKKLKKKGK